jgi:hypothetical protein
MGTTNCSDACIDTQSDPMNCGACGMRCAAGLFCVRATCTTAPPTRYMRVPMPPTVTFVPACMTPGAVMMLAGADDASFLTPLAFPFRYWATDLMMGAMVNVSSNGFLNLNGVSAANLSGIVPSTSTPNATIAAYWGDNQNRGAQCVATVGTAPSRQQVFLWNDAMHCCGEDPAVHHTYEVILNETGTIDVLYQTMMGAEEQTVGIENQTGTAGVPGCADGTSYSCVPATGQRVRYTPIP